MAARFSRKWRPKTLVNRILGSVAIGLVGIGIGASAPEMGTKHILTKAEHRLQEAQDKGQKDDEYFKRSRRMISRGMFPESNEAARNRIELSYKMQVKKWDENFAKIDEGHRRVKSIKSFRGKARPIYLSAGGILGLLAALGMARVAGRFRRKNLQKKFQLSFLVTPARYDSERLYRFVRKVNWALTKRKQLIALQELQAEMETTDYPYLTRAFRVFENFTVVGDSILFFNKPKQKDKAA